MTIQSAPTANDTRNAALIMTHADPTDERLRSEIAKRGLIAMAAILAGDTETPEDFTDWDAFTRWSAQARQTPLRMILLRMQNTGIRFITSDDAEWPAQVDDLEFPPFGLFLAGMGSIPEPSKMVTLGGPRSASEYGLSMTDELASAMASRGYTIVAGSAFGIDIQAHTAAMAAASTDNTASIAVLSGGLDRLQPSLHTNVLLTVASRGLLVSEIPPGVGMSRMGLRLRDRLIAALSGTTVVVEARGRTAILNTAAYAREMGRKVAAVPGSAYAVDSLDSEGCERLLQSGAAARVANAAELVALVAA